MAEDETKDPADSETPSVVVPSRQPLPPPPEVSYTRPSLGYAAPAPRVHAVPNERSNGDASQDPNLLAQGTQSYGVAITAAISLAVTLVIFVVIGLWLDKRFNPGGLPWFTIAGVILGVFGGFTNMIRLLTATGNRSAGKRKK